MIYLRFKRLLIMLMKLVVNQVVGNFEIYKEDLLSSHITSIDCSIDAKSGFSDVRTVALLSLSHCCSSYSLKSPSWPFISSGIKIWRPRPKFIPFWLAPLFQPACKLMTPCRPGLSSSAVHSFFSPHASFGPSTGPLNPLICA